MENKPRPKVYGVWFSYIAMTSGININACSGQVTSVLGQCLLDLSIWASERFCQLQSLSVASNSKRKPRDKKRKTSGILSYFLKPFTTLKQNAPMYRSLPCAPECSTRTVIRTCWTRAPTIRDTHRSSRHLVHWAEETNQCNNDFIVLQQTLHRKKRVCCRRSAE